MIIGCDAVLLEEVTRSYGGGVTEVVALRRVSVGFPRGSFTAAAGPSGSGKSTLLQCTSGLDRPQSGVVRVAGEDITRLREEGTGRAPPAPFPVTAAPARTSPPAAAPAGKRRDPARSR
ncbi:ATP-binding cassette domain-containing protein [Planomonospora alba]